MNAVYLIVGAFAVASALCDLSHPNALMVGGVGVVMIVAAVAATVEPLMPLTKEEARRRANLLRGQWVRLVRASRDMTRKQLAARLKVSLQSVSSAEERGLTSLDARAYEEALQERCPVVDTRSTAPRDIQGAVILLGLRAVWKAKGWTVGHAISGVVARPTMHNWARGVHNPSRGTLERLCERAGADPIQVQALGRMILTVAGVEQFQGSEVLQEGAGG